MKNLILTAVAVFTFGAATAQDMKFGIKAGLNIASTTEDNAKSKIGGNFGVFGEFKVSDKFSVQPEILYSLQGLKLDFNGTTLNGNLNYINIPIMAKFKVADAFSLQAGPQIGFLMTAEAEANGNKANVKDNLNGVDFGLNLGAGYDITENFMIDARYNIGLTNIEKNLASNQNGSKNRVISINLGYKF